MPWKCPACGAQRAEDSATCSCGYSFCKILGIKPTASLREAKQAYSYLQTVWQKDSDSQDVLLQKKAKERLKRIDEAFAAFKQYAGPAPAAQGIRKIPKVALIASGIVLLVTVLVLLLIPSSKKALPVSGSANVITPVPAAPAGQAATSASPQGMQQSAGSPPSQSLGDISEEAAVDLVKKSQVLFPKTMTEAIVQKWTDENAGKFTVRGWKAKRMNDQKYFVSYTVLEGSVIRGFYFELDPQTGIVLNIANNPELQKTYRDEISQ